MSLLRHRPRRLFFKNPLLFSQIQNRPHSASPSPDARSNLSARLSFVFDQIDAIDSHRSATATADRFDALQRIRQWRESRNQEKPQTLPDPDADKEESKAPDANYSVAKKDVEVVHPWPEWIELIERLGQQNYFDLRRRREGELAESVGIDLGEVVEETGIDFARDWTTVRNACMNFGRDRFDILR